MARAVLIAALFAILAGVNVRGVKPGDPPRRSVTVAKLLPLLVLVAAGIWFVQPAYLRWPGLPSAAAIGQTAIVLIFAFVGLEVALVPSGEVRDPARTVPRALFSALAITTTLYLLIQMVAQGLLGPAMATYSARRSPKRRRGCSATGGRLLVLLGAVVSMFGYVSGDMLGSPRDAVRLRPRRRAAGGSRARPPAFPHALRRHRPARRQSWRPCRSAAASPSSRCSPTSPR